MEAALLTSHDLECCHADCLPPHFSASLARRRPARPARCLVAAAPVAACRRAPAQQQRARRLVEPRCAIAGHASRPFLIPRYGDCRHATASSEFECPGEVAEHPATVCATRCRASARLQGAAIQPRTGADVAGTAPRLTKTLFRGPFDVQGEWATGGVESEPPGDRPTPLSFCLRPPVTSAAPSAAIVGSSPLPGLRAPSLHSLLARSTRIPPSMGRRAVR